MFMLQGLAVILPLDMISYLHVLHKTQMEQQGNNKVYSADNWRTTSNRHGNNRGTSKKLGSVGAAGSRNSRGNSRGTAGETTQKKNREQQGNSVGRDK